MRKLAIIAALVATTAHAEFLTGNKLRELMENPDQAAIATGYVMGVFDAGQRAVHCPPAGITGRQVVEITKFYMNANPDRLHHSADSIILVALSSLWPCERRPRGERQL